MRAGTPAERAGDDSPAARSDLVVVVGGGFAGLSAAAALAEHGKRVLVVDARAQLGGRATAFRDRETGELVDNGQHVLFGCYRATFEFLERIHAADRVRVQRSLAIPYIDRAGRRSVLRCPTLPSPLHLLAGVLAWDGIPWRDRLSVLNLAAALRRARREFQGTGTVTADPNGTVSEWLIAHGQRPMLRTWLWEPLAVAALNQSPSVAAASPFVRVLAQMFGPDPHDSALVLPTRPLHDMYAEPARTFIESRGGEVRVNALARVVVENGQVCGVDVRGDRVAARHVISAVPWFDLGRLFNPAPPPPLAPLLASAAGMASMPIVTVNLWYDRRVMEDAFIGLPGRDMQWVFDKRIAFGADASHLSLVSSGATRLTSMTRDELTALAAGEVEEAIPAARRDRLVRGTVVREKRATFSLAPGEPARPGTTTAVKGLYLAGDWIDTGLPGTIESAVVSGHRAARELLIDD
ncbi:MAG: hydroxysqualene dehydroxylase HpnE [Vicinamibacterales bacterium]